MASFPPPEDVDDDFLEQILSMPFCGAGGRVCGSEHAFLREEPGRGNRCVEQEGGGIQRPLAAARSTSSVEAVTDVAVACRVPRQKVRAKRGQATNPHSIAERIRREKITEKIKALQELVPSCNKTDRAVMLDELLDYVKFLRLQVKVLSLSRIGGTGAFSQHVADTSLQQIKGEGSEEENKLQLLERWSTSDDLEQQVAELLQEDIGAALQFLQSKSLCIVPISLAAFISQVTDQSGAPSTVMPDTYAPS